MIIPGTVEVFNPGECLICKNLPEREKRYISVAINQRIVKDRQTFVECSYGHRTHCHVRDLESTHICPRRGCGHVLVIGGPIKKRIIRVRKNKIDIKHVMGVI
jgi:hypothetical protein